MSTLKVDQIKNIVESSVVNVSDIASKNAFGASSGSSLVGFNANGVGAVTTTVQNKLRESVSVKDFGAVGDGVTDDYAAIIAAINSFTSATSTYYAVGPTIYFPPGNYYCSQAINLKKTVRMIGETSGHTGGVSVTLTFPAGSDGIIVNRYNTNGPTGTTTNGKGADGSLIEGIAVTQANYVLSSAPILDYNSGKNQFISNILGVAFSVGTPIYVPNEFLVPLGSGTVSGVDITTHVLDLATSPANFVIGETVTGGVSGATGVVVYVGAQTKALGLKTVTGTLQANETITGVTSATTQKISAVYSRSLTVYTLSGIIGTFTIGNVAISSTKYGTGIRLRARATVRNCQANLWPNFGVAVIAGETGGTNANLSIVEDTSATGIGIHGFVSCSGDANAVKFSGLNAVSCGGYGIRDASFLGNHYYSCHVSDCGVGPYFSSSVNNFSVFLGCYSEGMTQTQPFRVPQSTIGRESTIIGGDHGAGFDAPDNGYAYNSGYTYINGRNFRIGQGVFATQGMEAGGRIADTLRFTGIGAAPNVVTLAVRGTSGNGYGPAISYRLPYGNSLTPSRDDGSDSIYAGKVGVYRAPYHGSYFGVDLIPMLSGGVYPTIAATGGAPSRAAVFYPIVSGGVITSLQIVDPGTGYTSAPTLSGTDVWAGFAATTEIFNGQVVAYTIINGLSGLQNSTPERAFTASRYWVTPGVDNVTTLGSPTLRWSTVYAATGTINTSDARTKQQIRDLSESEHAVASRCKKLLKAFKFNDSVAEKGDKARIHFGVIAQDVKAAFEAEGLDAMKYAILCYDKWDAEPEVKDEKGDIITLAREAGDRYGVRYEQLLAFMIAAL